MATALLVLVLLQPATGIGELADPARGVRERAIAELATGATPVQELAAHLGHDDARVATGLVEVLRRRAAVEALPALARLADAADGARARPAAAALAEIALAHRVPLATLHFDGRTLLERRLQAAVADAVEGYLLRFRTYPGIDRPQSYRGLLAAGEYGEAPLRAIVEDGDRAPHERAHALHALSRLAGARAEPIAVALFEDPQPRVRAVAAGLIARVGSDEALAKLAALLSSDRLVHPDVQSYAASAVRATGVAGPVGVERLVSMVRAGPIYGAPAAAAALRRVAPERVEAVVSLRVREMAKRTDEVAMFFVRGEAEPPESFRRLPSAALRALVEPDREKALEILRPVVAPAKRRRNQESTRVKVVYELLCRLRAPWRDRVAFAEVALHRDSSALRRYALWALAGAPPARWGGLRLRVARELNSPSESVRLAAAALLAPRPEALRVLIDALYDGDPRSARTALRILRRGWPDLPSVDPGAPVLERRRLSLELARRADAAEGPG